MLPAQGAPHAAGAEPLLRPTPLVLKDGRIANVSIHVLPFASGKAELAAEPAEYLAKLTRAVGTDCFLTAQVIGHIASNEIAGDDTLNAHRLARSRADAVQASLIGGGLPAKAIASVWDWQFMVREPRATLWVFELTAGEDCEGRQLHGDLVAEAPSAEQDKAAPERVTKPALAPAEPPAASAAKPAGAPAKPAVTAAEPAVTAAKPAVTGAKPAATARGDAASQVAQPSQAPATQPPVVAHVEAVPPAAESRAARSQPEPGQTRQAAAKLAGAVPAAEPQTAAPARPAEQTATAEPQTRVPGQAAERPATGEAQTFAPAQLAEQAAGAEARIAAAAPSAKQPAAAEPKSAAPDQVAEQPATAKAQTAAPAPAAEQPATAEPKSAAPDQVAEQPATAKAQTAAPAPAAEQPATAEPKSTAPTQVAEQPATAEPQTVARAEPAEQAAIAAAPAATPQSPAKPSTDDGKVESGSQGGLIITFATNSSYFPSGAAARLRELLAGANSDKKYEVTLQVAVSGTTQVVGAKSADEAARYNKWLADRRVERVQAWLAKNAGAQALSIKPEYVANDDSRRLTVRVVPTG
jgi:hypothetical protein